MEITIKVPDELVSEAEARGMALRDYVESLVDQRRELLMATNRLRTPQEVRTWLESLAQFSDKIPPLPENISREWIYQDLSRD